jgi:flagellar biosynthesis protein FlhG
LASFDFDQAEGLRRMLAGPKPRIVTFLSATESDDKGAMLVNLGASLAHAGNDVLIIDACEREYGVARRLGVEQGGSLLQVSRQECALNQVIHQVPQGFSVATLAREQDRNGRETANAGNVVPAKAGTAPPGCSPHAEHAWPHRSNATIKASSVWAPACAGGRCRTEAATIVGLGPEDARRLATTFDVMVKQAGIVMVDGEFGPDGAFPLPIMASSEIVVQVSTSATSITNAYALIKRLSQQLGRRPFGILVTGATEEAAKVVYDNMATAATRYLAVTLTSMGSVPADEYLQRAARLGRAVVDAFPLAGASVAFRRLAGRFALPARPQLGRQGGSAHFGT